MKLNLKSDRKWILMTWDSALKYLGNNYETHLVVLIQNFYLLILDDIALNQW